MTWAPDSRRLVYVSDRDGTPRLFLYDFNNNTETQLTRDAADDSTPRFSPDGKLVAFIRGAKELRVMDMAGMKERVVVTAFFERPPIIADRPFVWSPDSKWLAYVPVGENQFKKRSYRVRGRWTRETGEFSCKRFHLLFTSHGVPKSI